MRKVILSSAVVMLLFAAGIGTGVLLERNCLLHWHDACDDAARDSTFTFPAEWEPHESIWMGWPAEEYAKNRSFKDVQIEVIQALAGHVKIDLAVQDEKEAASVKELLRQKGVPHDHVRFHAVRHTDIWFRDMGPLFVKNQRQELRVVDFKFNLWGTADLADEAARIDGQVDTLLARRLNILTIPSSMILEGGALEFNGQGTVITTEAVVFDRNPQMNKPLVEAELKRLFGVKKVIWIKEGMADDDSPLRGVLPGRLFTMGTNGHADEFVRFVDTRTVLLTEVSAAEAEVDPVARISRERMEAAHEALKKATDQDGNLLRIIRVPAAPRIVNTVKPGDYMYDEFLAKYKFKDGTQIKGGEPIQVIAATSYLNFLVTKGVVLVPKYGKPDRPELVKEKDEQVRRLLGGFFPDRKVVQINAEDLNLGGGGIHCITQQQPARNDTRGRVSD
jgi:agmatine deiminase